MASPAVLTNDDRVVFQKWRWTEIAVTLGIVFIASNQEGMAHNVHRCPLPALSE
jgi:hypothetical protein